MSEDKNEKVDWVLPLSEGVVLGKRPVLEVEKAVREKGFRLDNVKMNNEGQVVADVGRVVVEGMPAPRKSASKDQKH